MRETYVPFHYNETENITLFYDYETNEFFTSPGAKRSSFVATYSGTAGVVIYAVFKDLVINIGGNNPLFMVGFSLILSLLVAFGTIWGFDYIFKKNLDKIEIVDTPTKKEMATYIQEGEKWLKSGLFMTFFIFLFTLIVNFFFLYQPNNLLLFTSNTILWALILILIRGFRPLKRRTIYKQFKKAVKNEQELI